MFEFYLPIKYVHVAAVLFSGALLLLRGLGVQVGAHWPGAAPVRYLSYTVDTVLLTAALMLVTLLPHGVFANGWLTVKLTLIVAYVVLGSYALRRGRTRRSRAWCLGAAVLTYACIVMVAHSHDPLGPVHYLSRLAG